MYNFPLHEILVATGQTLYMVFLASFFSIIIGVMLGIALFLTAKKQPLAQPVLHQLLGFMVNVGRSVPFIILMIALIPLTRWLVGSSIGMNAAVVPLTLAAIPFFARITESALAEVPLGLIEAAHAMGATTTQIIYKIMLPEAMANLTRGATLTIISLIGYSAMAGAVGGGGLGQLAIDYGYERFHPDVMIVTVVILVLMVQFIQYVGNQLALKPRIKLIGVASLILLIGCFGNQLWPVAISHADTKVLRVGVMSGVSEQVMQVAAKLAKKQYHLSIIIVPFDDYVLPNTALNNGDIDANIFQHQQYLDSQIQARGYQLIPIAKTFIYPMGFYSRTIKTMNQLPEGAKVAIPNDPSNEGRALLLLAQSGLIQLKSTAGLLAEPRDIINNPKNLRFEVLAAAQLPRVFQDADLVALTNDYIKAAGFTLNQALIKENSHAPYANLIVVRQQDQNNPAFKELILVMHSPEVLQAEQAAYPNGAAISAYN